MDAKVSVGAAVFMAFVMIAGCGGAEAPEPGESVADAPVESTRPASDVADEDRESLIRYGSAAADELVPLIFDFFKKSLVIWGHRGLERCAVRTASPSRGSRRLFSST